MVGDTSVEDFDPKVADNKVKSDLIPCELEIGNIDPTIELKVEPILASMDKPAEEFRGKSAYAYEVFDKMTEPTLNTDRVSVSEVNVLEVVQSSEGEEAERGEEESPAMEFLEEGPVASESKCKARGKRVVACNVSEKRSLLKQDEPGAGYRQFGFDQNGARKSWADIVGIRGILYPKPLGSESNEEVNENKGTKREKGGNSVGDVSPKCRESKRNRDATTYQGEKQGNERESQAASDASSEWIKVESKKKRPGKGDLSR
ncbi:hypothetical protein U1Q18_037911, partial [Sarracenia purpurea var. burkii]